ncbi:MAG: type II secretion system protein [Planctomycetota bacterium]
MRRSDLGWCRGRGGFTLVELLVGIAVLSLLIGIMVPAVGAARRTAMKATSAARIRSLAQAQFNYAADSRQWLAGPNTSGDRYDDRWVAGPVRGGWEDLWGVTSASTPTRATDWISTVIGDSAGLSPDRPRRLQQILNEHGDPTARPIDSFWPSTRPIGYGDLAQFDAIGASEFLQTSYLMPITFQLIGDTDRFRTRRGDRLRYKFVQRAWFADGATVPSGYLPKLDRVGRVLARKVMIAEGSRMVTKGRGLSINIHPQVRLDQPHFGNFMANTPIYHHGSAYGRDPTSPYQVVPVANVRASYRHPGPSINAAMFDGSVRSMTQTESYTDPTPWFPSGSTWTGRLATPESIEFMADVYGGDAIGTRLP